MSQKKSRPFKMYGLGMSLLLLGAIKLGLHHYELLKADELTIKPGTYDYYILVPKIIKGVPKVGMVLNPVYYNRYGFDEHDSYEMIYLSKENPETIRSQTELYFIDRRFPKISNGSYRTGDASSIHVNVRQDPNSSGYYQVCVQQLESYKE